MENVENVENNLYEQLYEEYIQSDIPTGTDAIGDLVKYNNFINSKEIYFHTHPGLEARLIYHIRKNLFEVIDDWLEWDFMTLENHRNYENVFRRYGDHRSEFPPLINPDGSRKSKIRKSKIRKSKNRKSKNRKSKNRKSKN